MSSLHAKSSTFNPALSALFASSAGPLKAPPKPKARAINGDSSKGQSSLKSSASKTDAPLISNQTSSSESSDEEREPEQARPRKRRKVDKNEDLESVYLDRLAREEEAEQKVQREQRGEIDLLDKESDTDSDDLNSELEDITSEDESTAESLDDQIPVHETVAKDGHEEEQEKLKRTVFLGNVATSAITSKPDKKALVHHLETALDPKLGEKVESIRFRSTAFVSDAGPKRAAYAKKELMNETMKSTNAYAVLSSDAAARKVATRLNGTIVLGRHLRADNLGAPMKTDNRRCVFVGNLSFVDEETTTEQSSDGQVEKRKKGKEPADVEEGLWRTFGRAAKVESVRVVRDKETRVSKGFAYVQFHDENGVEAALGFDGKKFPPMLPRNLRVMRAKRVMKADKRIRERGAAHGRNYVDRRQSAEKVLFEGHRASSANVPKMLKKSKKKRPAVKPTNRSSKRGTAFKASGGKKKRDA